MMAARGTRNTGPGLRPRMETLTSRVQVAGNRLRVRLAPAVLDGLKRTTANPAVAARGRLTPEWLDAYLERMAVVEDCRTCGRPLIAEEVEAHALQHVPARVRPLATMALGLSPDDRETLAAFLAAQSSSTGKE